MTEKELQEVGQELALIYGEFAAICFRLNGEQKKGSCSEREHIINRLKSIKKQISDLFELVRPKG